MRTTNWVIDVLECILLHPSFLPVVQVELVCMLFTNSLLFLRLLVHSVTTCRILFRLLLLDLGPRLSQLETRPLIG